MALDRRLFIGTGATALVGLALLREGPLAASPASGKTFAYRLSEAEWRKKLGPKRFRILREAGTERPYSSPLLKERRKGTYHCAGCNQPLFPSSTKYDSRTGWPSFWAPLKGRVGYARDTSYGMVRTEEHCSRCGGHLGHLFKDGPKPTGDRHCINGLSLRFVPA